MEDKEIKELWQYTFDELQKAKSEVLNNGYKEYTLEQIQAEIDFRNKMSGYKFSQLLNNNH